jgi:hypothetical protein
LNKRAMRIVYVAAATAVVCVPLIAQQKNNAGNVSGPGGDVVNVEPPKALPGAGLPNVDDNKVVITYGDHKVTAGEFKLFFSLLSPQDQHNVLQRREALHQLAEDLVATRLLAGEAKRQKLDERPVVKMQIEVTLDNLLAQAEATTVAEQTGEDEKFFREHSSYFDQITAHQILIAVAGSGVPGASMTEQQAIETAVKLKARLDKGEDFAALARQYSNDTYSAARGGLDPLLHGEPAGVPPQVLEAAFEMKKNDISRPIHSPQGYHLIQVKDRKPLTLKEAGARVWRRRLELVIDGLKSNAKPQYDDSFFNATPPAPTGAATPPNSRK